MLTMPPQPTIHKMNLSILPIYHSVAQLPTGKPQTIWNLDQPEKVLRKIVKTIFPNQKANWHKEQLLISQNALKAARKAHWELVRNTFLTSLGCEPQWWEYRADGIEKCVLPEEAKAPLRESLALRDQWQAIVYAHYAGSRFNA